MEGSLPHGRARPRALTAGPAGSGRRLTPADAEKFIRANTSLAAPPHVPEIRLHLADEAHDLWLKTEDELAEIGLPPPFWAFAWAGGQGLARYVLDHPQSVRGRTVLDFASGSGLVAIAAAKAGAASVVAADIDPFTAAAIAINAAANGVELALHRRRSDRSRTTAGMSCWPATSSTTGRLPAGWCHGLRRWPGAARWCSSATPAGPTCRRSGCEPLAEYRIAVTRALEDAEVKRTTVWRLP